MKFVWALLRCQRALIVAATAAAIVLRAHTAEAPAPVQRPVTNSAAATTKLIQAVHAGDLSMLRTAIADGGDVNAHETGDLPPLLALLRTAAGPLNEGRRQCAACLLESGATVDPTDDIGRTPLIHAARLGDLETIKVLVEREAYVKTRDRLHKTALFYAVESGRPDIVRYLASHGDLVSLTIKERKLLAKH